MSAQLIFIRGIDRIRPAGRSRTGSTPRFADVDSAVVSALKGFLRCLGVGVLAMVSYFLISHYILQSVEIVGVSMVPTLHNADHYFVNRCTYYLHAPERGDVVVIKDPTDGKYSVKRIVALAGESLLFKDGLVYINGRALDEPYLDANTLTFAGEKSQEMITCGQGQFFVLGDNRNNSFDSRIYGPIPRENILGVVMH